MDKTYQAHVAGVPDEVDLARLRGGIMLDDGPRPKHGCVSSPNVPMVVPDIWLVIHTSNLEVKRMCAAAPPGARLAQKQFRPLELVDVEEGLGVADRRRGCESAQEVAGL